MSASAELDALFGELRSMLGRQEEGRAWWDEFCALIEWAHELDPRVYHEQWVPHVTEFVERCEAPIGQVDELRELERLNVLLPMWRVDALRLSCVRDLRLDALEAMLNAPLLERLRRLDIRDAGLGDGGAAIVAGAPCVEGLHELGLGQNDIGDDGLAELLNAPLSSALKQLDLSQNRIGDRGAFMLANAPALSNLEALFLRDNPISDFGFHAIEHSPYLEDPFMG